MKLTLKKRYIFCLYYNNIKIKTGRREKRYQIIRRVIFVKKMVSLVLLVVMALCMMQAVSFAATVGVANATMTYVGVASTDNGTGYEYSVTVNATATGTDEVSILMFGTPNNSAFVTGDTVNLAVGDAAAQDYYVYYVDQTTAAAGEAAFSFNVVLPESAANTQYYIWAGSTSLEAGKLDKTDLAAYGKAFAIDSVVADKVSITEGESVAFTIATKDVFGDAGDNTQVDVVYKDSNNNYVALEGAYSNGAYVASFATAGTYNVYGRLTRKQGEVVYSTTPVVVTVNAAVTATGIKGDADNDGYITTMDAVKVLKVEANNGEYPFPAQVPATDAAVSILKHVARIEFIA